MICPITRTVFRAFGKKRKEKLKMKKFYLAVFVLAVFFAANTYAAQYTMKIASSNPADPLAMPASAACAIFQAKVAEYTNGRVEVKIFPDGQLGDQLSGLQQVKTGEIQGNEIAMGIMANLYPEIAFTDLPYIIPDMKVAQDLYKRDNPFMKTILQDMEKKTGVGILFFAPQAYRNLSTTKKQVKSVKDLKDLKIRTMQVKMHIDMFNAAGAQAVPVPWLEVYTSLQTGVVDGQENPIATINAMHFYEVQKYITLTRHVHLVGAVTYNVKWLKSLPADLQVAIMKAAAESSVGSEALAVIYDVSNAESMQKRGVVIYEPTPAEIQGFKQAMQPAAFKWYTNKIKNGDKILNDLQKEIQRLQDSYKNLIY